MSQNTEVVLGEGFSVSIGSSVQYSKPALKHPEITYVPEPRSLKWIHIDVEDPLGRGRGTVELKEIKRTEFLENWGFPQIEPESYKNLQTWLNHQGGALYNPIWWREEQLEPRRTRYPWRIGKYVHLHGGHRCRALERLQFPSIYVYVHKGPTFVNPTNPNWRKVSQYLQLNDVEPHVYTEYGVCEKCGVKVRWGGPPKTGDRRTSGAENFKATKYDCYACGYVGTRPEIYPEPV